MSANLYPLVLLAPLMIAVAIGDLAHLRISNRLVVAVLVFFCASVPVFAADEILLRLAAGIFVFAAMAAMFALGLMGGGDVKVLPALVLFVPPVHWSLFSIAFAISLLVGVVAVGAARRLAKPHGPTGWLAMDTPRAFPMGISIALAGLMLPAIVLMQ